MLLRIDKPNITGYSEHFNPIHCPANACCLIPPYSLFPGG